jgi:hypothetical protein
MWYEYENGNIGNLNEKFPSVSCKLAMDFDLDVPTVNKIVPNPELGDHTSGLIEWFKQEVYPSIESILSINRREPIFLLAGAPPKLNEDGTIHHYSFHVISPTIRMEPKEQVLLCYSLQADLIALCGLKDGCCPDTNIYQGSLRLVYNDRDFNAGRIMRPLHKGCTIDIPDGPNMLQAFSLMIPPTSNTCSKVRSEAIIHRETLALTPSSFGLTGDWVADKTCLFEVQKALEQKLGVRVCSIKPLSKTVGFMFNLYEKDCLISPGKKHKNWHGRSIIVMLNKVLYCCLSGHCQEKFDGQKQLKSVIDHILLNRLFKGLTLPKKSKTKKRTPSDLTVDESDERSPKKKERQDGPLQIFIPFLYENLKAQEARRKDGNVYTPIKTQEGKYTGAFKRVSTISEWVDNLPLENNEGMMKIALSCGIDAPAKWLKVKNHSSFPILERDKRFRSFKSFQWDMFDGTFIPHSNVQHEHISCMYYDYDPSPEEMKDPQQVDTSVLDTMLYEQGWSVEEIIMFYALSGRLLNRLDKIQASMFIRGQPGTGKSTVFSMFSNFFPPEDTTTLGQETTFEFQDSYHKDLLISPETPKKFKMDQCIIQSIIFMNDKMKLAKKSASSANIDRWTCPSVWGGNRFLEDETGAFYR